MPSGEKYLSLTDSVKGLVKSEIAKLHTIAPGVIVKFDEKTFLASVQPLVKFFDKSGNVVSFGIIPGVPVILQRNTDSGFFLPVLKDTAVELHFSERCIEEWLNSDGKTEVQTSFIRKYDLNDCFALVGLQPSGKGKLPSDNTSVQIWHKKQSIIMKDDGTINIGSVDGKDITLQTSSGTKVTIKDSGDIKLENSSQSITMSSSGNISLGNATLKSLITEDFITNVFNNFINTTFNTHLHPTTSPGAPTGVPAVPGTPAVLAAVSTSKTKAQ